MCAADAFGADAATLSAAREELCRCLAECFFAPTTELQADDFFATLRSAAEQLGPALTGPARRLGDAFASEQLPVIAADHARLFLSSKAGLPAPHASAWLDPGPLPERGSAIAALYEQAGFVIDAGYEEPPDHVAVELEFLYLLIHRENLALRRLDADALQAAQRWRVAFLQDHLGRWLPAFLQALQGAAQTAFYRSLAELCACYLQLEVQRPLDPRAP